MVKKKTPILSILLYGLSGLNFLVMIVCVIIAANADGSLRSNAFFLQAIFGTLADVFLGYLTQAIRGISLLFTLINAGISILLFTAAGLVKNSHSISFRVQQLESRMETATVK